jgi:hypothetical protein
MIAAIIITTPGRRDDFQLQNVDKLSTCRISLAGCADVS